jgi:hypothetical protein
VEIKVSENVELRDLKKIVEEHMKQEIEIMKIILTLEKESVEDFRRWYISHVYYKGIGELIENVKRGGTGNENQRDCNHIVG